MNIKNSVLNDLANEILEYDDNPYLKDLYKAIKNSKNKTYDEIENMIAETNLQALEMSNAELCDATVKVMEILEKHYKFYYQ